MDKVYVGLDLGSSTFQQAAINQDGVTIMNRSFPTSEANLRSEFANLRGKAAHASNRVSCLSKPNLDHRPRRSFLFRRESQIPEWQEKKKDQNGRQDGAQANDVVTRKTTR